MASIDLVNDNPNPSEDEVREGIEGNLCRCTGYQNIVRAVQQAAAEMNADDGSAGMTVTEDRRAPPAPDKEVGKARRRKEDARLITGKTTWTDNMVLPGMLHLAVVRSPVAHAKITNVDLERRPAGPRRRRRLQRPRLRRGAGLHPLRLAGHPRHGQPRAPVGRRRGGQPRRRGRRGDRRPQQDRRAGRRRAGRHRLRPAARRCSTWRRRSPRTPHLCHDHLDVQRELPLRLRRRRGRHGRRTPSRRSPTPRSSSAGGSSSSG